MNKTKLKLFLTVLAFATVGSFMFAKPASALNPNDIPNNMRNDISNYDSICPGIPEKYMLNTWVSPSGQPTQTSLTVPYGTQDVNLDLNQLVFVCRQYVSTNGASYPGLPQDGTVSPTGYNGSVSKATSGFSATNGSLQNIGGLQAQSSIFRNNGTRYWFSNPVQFTYHANSPLTSTQFITVSFNQKFANIFNGSTACANPPGPGGTVGSLDSCNEGQVNFTITINVGPPPAAALQGFVLEENTGNTVSGRVTVQGVGSLVQNPFFFNGSGGPSVPAGTQTVNIDSIPAGYSVVGSTICGGSSPCGPGQPSSAASGQNFAAGSARTWNFDPGVTYDMRWILKKVVATTCGFPVTSPTAVEPTTNYSLVVSATVNPAVFTSLVVANSRFYVTVINPAGVVIYNNTNVPVIDNGGGIITGIVAPGPTNGTGTYKVNYGITGPWGAVTCGTVLNPGMTFSVGYHPYFRVEAGDVSAGAGFTKADGTCTASTPAQIRGLNNGSGGSPAFLGAGAQLGALALGAISGFPTSTNEGGGTSGVGAGSGTGLTFANTPTPGSFGSLPCVPDYATEALASAATVLPLSGTVNLATLASGTYQVTSGDISLGGNIPQGRQVTIVVMGGNAIVTNEIVYGGYASVSDAPQFKLIVTNGGNIKIKNDVTELHGAYIALPNTAATPATGGTISTCYDENASADTVDFNTCNHKLNFYGTVVANTLLLERTYGSLVAHAAGGVQVQPAETFNNTPELWAVPGYGNASTALQSYDSIVSLPPVL